MSNYLKNNYFYISDYLIEMEFKQKFYDITNLIQQEFDRNVLKYGDKLKCRRGCSGCCSQLFRITGMDAYIIREHIKILPLEEQVRLRKNAEQYLKKVSELKTGDSSNVSDDTIKKGDIPCPALGSEGECTIYEARPVVCRRFGIPIYDYKNPDNIYACGLNFSPGEEINDDDLIPNQTAIGMKWDELKDEFNESELRSMSAVSTTIAEAILK